jgi:spermidine synthase
VVKPAGRTTRQSARPKIALPALAALALFATAVVVVAWFASARGALGELEHEEVSEFSRIRIRRDGDIRALTFVRDSGAEAIQSRIDLTAPQTLVSPYARSMFAAYLYQPRPSRVLIVGLGGGAMVRFLIHHEPSVQIDAVEIDPVVVRLADQYFGVRSAGNVRVHTADAFAFIERTTDRYDMIFMDAFLRPSDETDATGVPSRLKTLEFLARVKQTLAPGGVVAFNINDHERIADDIASVGAAFGQVAVYRAPPADNKVVIATSGSMPPEEEIRARAPGLDARFGGALAFGDLLANRE